MTERKRYGTRSRCHGYHWDSDLHPDMRCELEQCHLGVCQHSTMASPKMVYRWDLGPKYRSWTELHGYMPQKARSREAG